MEPEDELTLKNKTESFKLKLLDEDGEFNDFHIRKFIKDHITHETRVANAIMTLEELYEINTAFRGSLKIEMSQKQQNQKESDIKYNSHMKGVKQNIPHKDEIKKKKSKKGNKVKPHTGSLVHPAHESFNMVFNIMIGVKKAIDSVSEFPLMEL
jgi:hypothetical protein